MTRSEAIKSINSYLAGTLSPDTQADFERVIRDDAGVRAVVERARQLETLLREQPELTPSIEFTATVLERVGHSAALEHAEQVEALLQDQPELTPSAEFTATVLERVGHSAALERAEQVEALLQDQPVLTPSADFTAAVMEQVGLDVQEAPAGERVSRREQITDWIQGLAPAALLIGFLIMFGKPLLAKFVEFLGVGGAAIDSAIGGNVFASNPLILVGIFTPLLGIAIISATVTRHLRLAS